MKLAFDPTAAEQVLRAVKARQLPRKAVPLLAGEGVRGLMGVAPLARTRAGVQEAQRVLEQKTPSLLAKGRGATVEKLKHDHEAVLDASETLLRASPKGAILQNQPVYQHLKSRGVALPEMSGPQKKMMEAVVKGHELAETQVRPGASMLDFGHASPDVLLREHNMVSTLPTEYGPVRDAMKAMRQHGGWNTESDLLQSYGVRYGESPRLSRHARKHVTNMIEADYQKKLDRLYPKIAMHGLEDRIEEHDRVKSRKGSIPSNVQTLMKVARMAAFADEVSKLSMDDVEVVEAAHKLQRPRPWRNIGQTALVVGAAAPAIDAAGRFTKGFVNSKGGLGARAAGGARELGALTAGDIAAKSVTAGLGGGAIAAAREGIEVHNARKAVRRYLDQAKLSSLFGGPPSGPGAPKVSLPAAPTLGLTRGSSNKSQRVGNTPIAAKSGVTQAASGDAMNPRRNIGDAMRAYKT